VHTCFLHRLWGGWNLHVLWMTWGAFRADSVVCIKLHWPSTVQAGTYLIKYMNGALTGTQWCNVCTDLLHISESDIKYSCSSYNNRQLFMSWKTRGVTGDPDGGKWPLSSFGRFISREGSPDVSCVYSVLIDTCTHMHARTHTKSVVKICFWFDWLGR